MTDQKRGEGIHTQGGAEEGSPDRGSGYPLIPEQGEASVPVEVTEGRAGNVRLYGPAGDSGPETGEQGLGPRLGHGAGRAQQGDPLPDQPAAHELPLMEVGGQEYPRRGFEFFEFILVAGSDSNRGSVYTMGKAQKVQGDMDVPAEADKGDCKAATARVGEQDGLFPSSYI